MWFISIHHNLAVKLVIAGIFLNSTLSSNFWDIMYNDRKNTYVRLEVGCGGKQTWYQGTKRNNELTDWTIPDYITSEYLFN